MTHTHEYETYLLSKEWKTKKKEVFNLHGRACFKCKSTQNIHVHHKTYKRLFHEDVPIDLIPLCSKCHESLHKLQEKKSMDVWAASEHFLQNKHRRLKPKNKKRKRSKKYREFFDQIPVPHITPHKPYDQEKKEKQSPGKIDLIKFMQMYQLDEETARSILN